MGRIDLGRADGLVLIAVLLLTLLMSALGVALSLVASSEAMIAANFRESREARYAAIAAAERAIAEAGEMPDWSQLLEGSVRSVFYDSAASLRFTMADSTTLEVARLTSQANCHREISCSPVEMDAVTAERPWGANNPRWQLFAQGWLRDVLPAGAIDSPYFTVVLVADDRLETDGNPLRDALAPQPGAGVIELRSYAFGPRGARRTVEVTVGRTPGGHARALGWRDLQ